MSTLSLSESDSELELLLDAADSAYTLLIGFEET